MAEVIKNLGEGEEAFVLEERSTDPVILPQPYVTPTDFAAQYPQPLDPTEILIMCEEVALLKFIPQKGTSLNGETWREMDELEFASGSTYLAFADGECPEEYEHAGDNTTVNNKNLGAKKTLSIRDIMHSRAVAAGLGGINTWVGGFPAGEGLPGGDGAVDPGKVHIADVKEKEIRAAMTLVLNGWDDMIVNGDHSGNSLEFTGIENWATNYSCTAHTNSNTSSGTFSAISFDRFLSEGCAKPDTLAGHPQAMQEVASAYFQLGYQGSQVINHADGNRIVPGFNFAGFINTGVGMLQVVADNNFRRNASGAGAFQADIWALRMTHNGEPLIYNQVQIPLSLNDLAPGCTAISFQVWVATSLIIKACCAQGTYTSQFTGRLTTTCTTVF